MSDDLRKRLEASATASLSDDEPVNEAELDRVLKGFAAVLGCSGEIVDAVRRTIMDKRGIRMDTGARLVAPDHHPWVRARKPSIDPFFWDRYRKYLERQSWPRGVLRGLDETTDEILDLLGNPEEARDWRRRGLVMGDVQSGKTSTYTGLICKAADAGYRVIILLSGMLESLRRQTQERLDAGFVGWDSSGELRRKRNSKRVGVGEIDRRRQAVVFTSRIADFSATTVQSLGISLHGLSDPALVVVKKNVRILSNLAQWLQDYNLGADGLIDLPVLLIDDEADNASVNINSSDSDPSRINECIRSILRLFRRSTYIGFTATPFANIFIDPDGEDEMLGDDLFPSDFIYSLKAPTNYFGPTAVFISEENGEESRSLYLREIDDAAAALPLSHKSSFEIERLPDSLHEALAAFIVANAIRDLRGEGSTHRSMLVNVSRFTAVQNSVEELLHQELDEIRRDIKNFSRLSANKALENKRIARLYEVWEREYVDAWPEWQQVQFALNDATLVIETRAVNQSTGAQSLDFRKNESTGLRVIAIGGNSLSRGLTLEGLCVSYFYRNSRMYDTLLQMGRWFGYRDGYRDLCRIWLTRSAIDWYGHIADATDELRAEITVLQKHGLAPRDFGLQVRAHPNALIVTARNKMRSSREIERIISVSGRAFESVELDPPKTKANWDLVTGFVADLATNGYEGRDRTDLGNRLFSGVPAADVARLVSSFQVVDDDITFQPLHLAALIGQIPDPRLEYWDVVVPEGKSDIDPVPVGPKPVQLQRRRVTSRNGIYVVSGNKRRVGSRGIEQEGVPSELVAEARALAASQNRNVSDRDFRAVRPRPLLLIHLLDAYEIVGGDPPQRNGVNRRICTASPFLSAIGVSFPVFDDTDSRKKVKYRINLVKFRELFSREMDDEEAANEEGDA